MLIPLLIIAGLGGGAYWLYRRSQQSDESESSESKSEPPNLPPIPAPPDDVISMSASQAGTTKMYTVSLVIQNVWDYVVNDTFVFYNENSAEAYYWVLKNFFDDPYVYKAYTYPSGTIMVHKSGSPPAVTRTAMYDQNGPMASA